MAVGHVEGLDLEKGIDAIMSSFSVILQAFPHGTDTPPLRATVGQALSRV